MCKFISNINRFDNETFKQAYINKKLRDAYAKSRTIANPTALRIYATNLYAISKKHHLAKSLGDVAQYATEQAIERENKLEAIANELVANGTKIVGGSGRFTQSVQHNGVVGALVKNVENGCGSGKFKALVEKNAVEYTAEYFVAKYVPFYVSAELLKNIKSVLTSVGVDVDSLAYANA